MPAYNPLIDAYIENAAPFARPVLHHLRELIHHSCPEVEETLKWKCPHFVYKGRNICALAAFKQHCAFGFSLASIMTDPQGILETEDKAAMGSMGRIASLKDLPSDKVLAQYIKQSVQLVDDGIKVKKAPRKDLPEPEAPEDFIKALRKNKKALAVFEQFAPSHRKEYLEWIREAKRAETREKRILQAIEWMAEGKPRHWRYQ